MVIYAVRAKLGNLILGGGGAELPYILNYFYSIRIFYLSE